MAAGRGCAIRTTARLLTWVLHEHHARHPDARGRRPRRNSPASRPHRRPGRGREAAALPVGIPRPRAAGPRLPHRRQAREHHGAGGDEAHRRRALGAEAGDRHPGDDARRLRALARVLDALQRAARHRVREGRPARHAPHRARGVPPPARAVAALPPRAPDRRAHARHRARHARHLHAALLHGVQRAADAARDRAGHRVPGVALRRVVRRDHRGGTRASTSPSPSRSRSGAPTTAAR